MDQINALISGVKAKIAAGECRKCPGVHNKSVSKKITHSYKEHPGSRVFFIALIAPYANVILIKEKPAFWRTMRASAH